MKAILLLILLMTLPLLLAGGIGIIFYKDVIKRSIWDDNLAQAKAVSTMTDQYMQLSRGFIESISTRPSVANAVEQRNLAFLNNTVFYAQNKSLFYQLYVTDDNGKILSSYPDVSLDGRSEIDLPYISNALHYGNTTIGYYRNHTGEPTIFVSSPIVGQNGTPVGVMVGELDTDAYRDKILSTQVKNTQFIYLVDNSGHIILHNNRTYMERMMDFSSVPAVHYVIQGNESILEQYNPIEHDTRLAAYSPVRTLGWGVVVALPVQVAYQPIWDATLTFLVALLAAVALAIISAVFIGNNLISPILGITKATSKMSNGGDYSRYLPLDRKDELGDLARAFDRMSRRIINGKNKLTEERDRAELYVDIMGHDINNLNQTALLNLELLADDKTLTDEQRQLIESSLQSVMGSAEIIENVRTIQKINSGELPMEPEDIDAMIQECINSAPRPEGRHITIRFSPGHGRLVNGPPLLKEAFCNLINNAVKHSEGDVEIDIDVSERKADGEKYYDTTIADNGPGIPDELKARLFRRFQRGATKAHGKGLGLYITKMLVEHSGGSVRVEDRVPGDHTKGAKFVVTLPAAGGDRHE